MTRFGTSAKGDERREQILTSAMKLLASEGYRNISLRMIGRTLGIEPAHVVYYYAGREELFRNVVERWDDDSAGAFPALLKPSTTLDAYVQVIRRNLKIPGIVHLYVTFAAEAAHRNHVAHNYFLSRFNNTRELLSAAIRYEQKSGRIGPLREPDREARKLIALADGLQLQALVDPSIDAPAYLASALQQLRNRL
ncbi:TetR/AcrR family transcriptional regulator [Pseudarthrobacter phenanthrenivorans]|uniref:TetR/AcrR family transcriptional regulator n=1 Tax=Pseudarthrobacter phenanthrenivorans TaxID=361575 RepID=UPI00344FFC8E